MDDLLEKVYGRGWGFPPVFSLEAGVGMASGAEDVQQSLIILLNTLPGERIMRQEYGCDLNQFMFANINAELMAEVETQIYDSVLKDEPRAELTAVNVSQEESALNRLHVQVVYRLRGSDVSQSVNAQLDIGNGRSAIS